MKDINYGKANKWQSQKLCMCVPSAVTKVQNGTESALDAVNGTP